MEGFKEYQSKPVTRTAYKIQTSDAIKALDEHTFEISIAGKPYVFKAYETIFPGDYVVFLDDSDIYHCRQAVFHERNHVDGPKGKTLHNSDISGARKNVKDIKVVGDGDLFQLLAKASSEAEGWMKSTKAMETGTGCLVQVTTQQRNPDGSYAVAEALSFVPGVWIVDDTNGGRHLSPIQ